MDCADRSRAGYCSLYIIGAGGQDREIYMLAALDASIRTDHNKVLSRCDDVVEGVVSSRMRSSRGCQGGSLLCLHVAWDLPQVEMAASTNVHNKHDPEETLRPFGSADPRARTTATAAMSLRAPAPSAIRARQEDKIPEGA